MRYFSLVCLFVFSLPLAAQQKPFDCAGSEPHRQFDFWLGNWEVHDPSGKLQGFNQIRSVQNGCLLTEHWKSVSGGSGESMNYYDPGSGKWRQLWVDGGASIIDISGGMDDGSMVLTGTIQYLVGGRQADFRGRWTPLPDGRVRQFFEERDAEGNWQPWYDLYYSPLNQDGPGEMDK